MKALRKILSIDQNGDILNEWQNDNLKTYSPKKIFKTPDGGYVFVSKYLKEIHEDGYPSYQGYICKLDGELTKEWELKIGHRSYTTNFYSMMQTYDGKFIAVGAVNDTFDTVDSWREYGWLVKFDEDGNIDWEQKIHSGINGQSVLTGIAETADHDLVACGLSQSVDGDYPQQDWLLKLDEYGCLDPNWCDTTYVATRPPPPELNELLQISPNPAQTSIRISFDYSQNSLSKATNIEHIQIFNLMGQEFMDKAYGRRSWVEVDVTDLPSGLYIVVVNGQWVRKVVVE